MRRTKEKKNQQGFTLIELMVVVTVMGIVGVVVVPEFNTILQRSRLTADISTIKTAQGMVDYYHQDNNSWPGTTVQEVINTLADQAYLDVRYLEKIGEDEKDKALLLQTDGAVAEWDNANNRLQLKVATKDYDLYNKQEDKNQKWIVEVPEVKE